MVTGIFPSLPKCGWKGGFFHLRQQVVIGRVVVIVVVVVVVVVILVRHKYFRVYRLDNLCFPQELGAIGQ